MNDRLARLYFWGMLCSLTFLLVAAQLAFFLIHYQVSDLIDSLVNSSISAAVLYPVILYPLIQFIVIQVIAYVLLICWVGFITLLIAEKFALKSISTRWLGILFLMLAFVLIFLLNAYYYPHSFFAISLVQYTWLKTASIFISLIFFATTLLAYWQLITTRRHLVKGFIFISLFLLMFAIKIYDGLYLASIKPAAVQAK